MWDVEEPAPAESATAARQHQRQWQRRRRAARLAAMACPAAACEEAGKMAHCRPGLPLHCDRVSPVIGRSTADTQQALHGRLCHPSAMARAMGGVVNHPAPVNGLVNGPDRVNGTVSRRGSVTAGRESPPRLLSSVWLATWGVLFLVCLSASGVLASDDLFFDSNALEINRNSHVGIRQRRNLENTTGESSFYRSGYIDVFQASHPLSIFPLARLKRLKRVE